MKLLIVDDDRRVRRMIAMVAADVSDEIFECADGVNARQEYAEHSPDWVLMDLMMPGLDGISATRQIVSSFPQARVIIITSHESSAMRERASKAGACGYVLKENLADLKAMMAGSRA